MSRKFYNTAISMLASMAKVDRLDPKTVKATPKKRPAPPGNRRHHGGLDARPVGAQRAFNPRNSPGAPASGDARGAGSQSPHLYTSPVVSLNSPPNPGLLKIWVKHL